VNRRTWILATAAALSIAALGAAPASFAVAPSQLERAGFSPLPANVDGDGVTVAVVDSGLDLDHPSFAGRIVTGWDFVDGDDYPDDENGHGTHVAGIVAASAGGATPGAAPGASIMPVRVLDASGAGSSETIADGILWAADHGADVINLSVDDSGRFDRIRKNGPIAGAIRAVSNRAVVVVAAGNDSQFEELFRAGVPALVVVAVDDQGQPAPFTNVGDPRAVAAPGVEVLSTAPTGPTTLFPSGTDGTATLSGTSMAAPFVSAEAALLIQTGHDASQVAETILASAQPTTDPRTGAGIIDAAAAIEHAGSASAPSAAPPTPVAIASATPTLEASPGSATVADDGSSYLLAVIIILGVLVVAFIVAFIVALRRP
jgi:subtilisin family serine protease